MAELPGLRRQGEIRAPGPPDQKKLPNWLHSWHLIELRQSPEASTSSMAGQYRRCEKGALLTITVSLISAPRANIEQFPTAESMHSRFRSNKRASC